MGLREHVGGREAVGSRSLCEPRLQVPRVCSIVEKSSLTKCKLKIKLLRISRQLLQSIQPKLRALLNMAPCMIHWSRAHDVSPGGSLL